LTQNFQIHKCELLPADVEITHTDTEFGEYKWSMTIYRTATEQDLELNHHLEEEGEVIWQTSIEILCCPYCGITLADTEVSKQESFGARRCHSFADWSGVEL